MKISELGLAGAIAGTEVFPIVQGGVTKKVSITDALAGAGGGVTELNGLTGALSITSTDNSVTITPSVDTIDLSVAGGSGGVNPTSTYIPYNNAGTFDDSFLINDTVQNQLRTDVLKGGFLLDFNTNVYYFGDFRNILNGRNYLSFEGDNRLFNITLDGDVVTQFAKDTNDYVLGSISTGNYMQLSGSGQYGNLYVNSLAFLSYNQVNGAVGINNGAIEAGIKNDGNFVFYTALVADGTIDGIRIDIPGNRYNFGSLVGQFDMQVDAGNKVIKMGDYIQQGNGTYFELDEQSANISFFAGNIITIYGASSGIRMETNITKIGDNDFASNGTTFGVDDNNRTLIGSNGLLRSTSGSASGQHLKINIGGTDYVIELKNP
jgi:hypothetical protein